MKFTKDLSIVTFSILIIPFHGQVKIDGKFFFIKFENALAKEFWPFLFFERSEQSSKLGDFSS
jgi:hypothetical protein